MLKLKVGLVGTSQLSFPGDKDSRFSRSAEGLRSLSEKLNFDLYTINETIITQEQAENAVRECEKNGVDFLLVHCTSFSAGFLAPAFARARAYLGLWAIPEGADDGPVPFNSFCSINMYASIIGHYMKEYNVPLKWFYGDTEDELFIKRFAITLKALSAIKNLGNSKVALIGGVAPGFYDLHFDERSIEKTFRGIKINRQHEFSEIKDRALSYKKEDITKIADQMVTEACGVHEKSGNLLETNARVYKAYKDFIAEYGYDALAISCWPKFQDDFNYSVCSVMAKLNDDGIVASCEGDVLSAISMLMLRYLAGEPTMLMDLSGFDEKDETVLMWHCGPAAKRYMNHKGFTLGVNYHGLPHEKGKLNCCGVVRDMVFAPEHVTIARITGEGNRMFLAEGTFIDYEKKSFFGSRGWLGNLKLNGESVWVRDLINTILVQRFQHHYPIVAGDVTGEINELAAWLNMSFVKKVAYQDYMQNSEEN